MAKIRVSFEADISDLKSLYPNDPKGITVENVADILHHALVCDANVRVLDTMMCRDHDEKNPVVEAILQHRKDEVELGQRLMRSIKIELLETSQESNPKDVSRKSNPERYLIDPITWGRIYNVMPKECQKVADGPRECVGIGFGRAAGWFILASGQGPHLVWAEHPDQFERVFGKF